MDAETKSQFERLNAKINTLLQASKKETWVGPSWITDLTGWNHEKMRQARDSKIIVFKDSPGGGYLYLLESLPAVFIKNKAEKPATSDHLKKAV